MSKRYLTAVKSWTPHSEDERIEIGRTSGNEICGVRADGATWRFDDSRLADESIRAAKERLASGPGDIRATFHGESLGLFRTADEAEAAIAKARRRAARESRNSSNF